MTVRVHSNFGSENSLLALPPVARSSVCRVTCTILHAAGSAAFPPILRGRSFDGTRDKWTARRGRARAGTAPRLLAASPLKCNMLFVTELWPKSSAIEGEGRIYKRGRVASRSSPPLSTFSMYVWTDATDDGDAAERFKEERWRLYGARCLASVRVRGGLFKKCRIPILNGGSLSPVRPRCPPSRRPRLPSVRTQSMDDGRGEEGRPPTRLTAIEAGERASASNLIFAVCRESRLWAPSTPLRPSLRPSLIRRKSRRVCSAFAAASSTTENEVKAAIWAVERAEERLNSSSGTVG